MPARCEGEELRRRLPTWLFRKALQQTLSADLRQRLLQPDLRLLRMHARPVRTCVQPAVSAVHVGTELRGAVRL